MQSCKQCLLPATVPGADLNARGVCAFCAAPARSDVDRAREESDRKSREADLERTLSEARGKGHAYDVLVCLSGGKDSLYLLHKLKVKYGLNVLAFTTDVSIPDVAWSSIRRTVEKLKVDHLIYRPPSDFYRKLFRYVLMNQEPRGAVYSVSHVYAPLFEGDALGVAVEKGIPLVTAGYSPGQPEPERILYEFSRALITKTDWAPPGLREAGVLEPHELARFWNPGRYPAGTAFPRYIAPFHAWPYDQDEIMREVVKLDLVAKPSHASPVFSNYPINWLMMFSDIQNFGYNPYAPEFAALVREGKANRSYWRIMGPVVDFMIRKSIFLGRNVTSHLRWLDLTPSDLRITKPVGAYDPVVVD